MSKLNFAEEMEKAGLNELCDEAYDTMKIHFMSNEILYTSDFFNKLKLQLLIIDDIEVISVSDFLEAFETIKPQK
jgi:hypothetical protein